MEGPGSSFEFTTLLNFGAGLDIRLGQNFLAGVALSAVTPMANLTGGGTRGSLEAGLHLSYSWNPNSSE